MKVQCLMRSPILNAVDHELIRFELVCHCLSCISCMYLITYITISLSTSDDLTLWKNLLLGKKLLLKLVFETLKLGPRIPKKKAWGSS